LVWLVGLRLWFWLIWLERKDGTAVTQQHL
jgi:hypothetical protein